eukprot:2866213-Pyramimonas_sp.AAC.1
MMTSYHIGRSKGEQQQHSLCYIGRGRFALPEGSYWAEPPAYAFSPRTIGQSSVVVPAGRPLGPAPAAPGGWQLSDRSLCVHPTVQADAEADATGWQSRSQPPETPQPQPQMMPQTISQSQPQPQP